MRKRPTDTDAGVNVGGGIGANRRDFLMAGATAGMGLGMGLGLGGATAAGGIRGAIGALDLAPSRVRFGSELEPVVRWIEDTPRETVLEEATRRLREGLSYRDFLGALFLAGIRNIKPRPVGFKFHAVMVIHSAHLLSQSVDPGDPLPPLFWALDQFKASQAADVQEGDWTLDAVAENAVPGPEKAKAQLLEGFAKWDEQAVDAAVAGVCRASGAAEVMELFWRQSVLDQRNIGHKPIFAMQCWRTLQAVGWEHAEPVLRSLAYGLLDLQGSRDRRPEGPIEANFRHAAKIRPGWAVGKNAGNAERDRDAASELAKIIRAEEPERIGAEIVALLNREVPPRALWDAILMVAHELLLKKPGIIGIHAVTSANALHYIFQASGDDLTRRLALLQAATWQPLYRGRLGVLPDWTLDGLVAVPVRPGAEGLAEIFATVNSDRTRAAAQTLGYLAQGGDPNALFVAAQRLIFRKGRDSHDYKFGAACFEEARHCGDPRFRGLIAAAGMANYPGIATPDSPLWIRSRAAVQEVLGHKSS